MYEIKLINNNREARLFGMGCGGTIFVDQFNVNLGDLCRSWRPGGIVRCDVDPRECVTFISMSDEPALGCVAGWHSESDEIAA